MGLLTGIMNMFSGLLAALPPVQINGQTLPPWMELAGLGLIVCLIMLSLLPRLLEGSGKLKNMPGMGSGTELTDTSIGQDYR